jgi:hypothetical protein
MAQNGPAGWHIGDHVMLRIGRHGRGCGIREYGWPGCWHADRPERRGSAADGSDCERSKCRQKAGDGGSKRHRIQSRIQGIINQRPDLTTIMAPTQQ